MIPIEDISPYDGHHPNTDEGWVEVEEKLKDPNSTKKYHDLGVDIALKGVLAGKEILPIAVRLTKIVYFGINRKYERLDGWKRYFGYKLAGKTTIPCHVYSSDTLGGIQQGQDMFIKEE